MTPQGGGLASASLKLCLLDQPALADPPPRKSSPCRFVEFDGGPKLKKSLGAALVLNKNRGSEWNAGARAAFLAKGYPPSRSVSWHALGDRICPGWTTYWCPPIATTAYSDVLGPGGKEARGTEMEGQRARERRSARILSERGTPPLNTSLLPPKKRTQIPNIKGNRLSFWSHGRF